MDLRYNNPTLYTEVLVKQLTPRSLALDAARNTVWKEPIDKEPTDKWWKKMLLAEHSPIRTVQYSIKMLGIPYWVSTHFVRHKIGAEHFISTQRSDRTGEDRDLKPQGSPVNHIMHLNAQSFITISRKRLCNCASTETRYIWFKVMESLYQSDPVLWEVCVPECVYRGFCPELKCCGHFESKEYNTKRSNMLRR